MGFDPRKAQIVQSFHLPSGRIKPDKLFTIVTMKGIHPKHRLRMNALTFAKLTITIFTSTYVAAKSCLSWQHRVDK